MHINPINTGSVRKSIRVKACQLHIEVKSMYCFPAFSILNFSPSIQDILFFMPFIYQEIEHLHFSSIDSTNSWAKLHAHEFPLDKILCITADHQTAGRGQFHRKWISPNGVNLYTTFCFALPKDFPFLSNLAQILSISCCRLLIDRGFTPTLKWPNDILLQGQKVAGVLCEIVQEKDFLRACLGIGINVNMEESFLQLIDQPATSLKKVSQKKWSLSDILHSLSTHFLGDLQTLITQGFLAVHPFYEKHITVPDHFIEILQEGRKIQGCYRGISPQGRMIVELPSGQRVEISSR